MPGRLPARLLDVWASAKVHPNVCLLAMSEGFPSERRVVSRLLLVEQTTVLRRVGFLPEESPTGPSEGAPKAGRHEAARVQYGRPGDVWQAAACWRS